MATEKSGQRNMANRVLTRLDISMYEILRMNEVDAADLQGVEAVREGWATCCTRSSSYHLIGKQENGLEREFS